MTDTIASYIVSETYDKNIRAYEEYDLPDGYKYKLDAVQFSRVIINLLSNAVKYCDQEPVITVRAKLSNQLKIEIEDNGIGIKEEYLKTVFNKFFRVNTQNKAKGLGLGLYIVKRIVENHHGTIHIKSTWGNGTTVTITLPK
jgi:two-component system phosphate regulon sensor histidine kinase PhoR